MLNSTNYELSWRSQFISMIKYFLNARVQATPSSHLSFDAVTQRANAMRKVEQKKDSLLFSTSALRCSYFFHWREKEVIYFLWLLQIGGEDTNITFEDQQQINTFARKSAKLKDEIEEEKVWNEVKLQYNFMHGVSDSQKWLLFTAV